MKKCMFKNTYRLACGVLLILFGTAFLQKDTLSEEIKKADPVFVKRVVDGDTIVLSDKTRVRLIGIDTPELHFSRKLLRDSKRSGRDTASIQKMGELAMEFTQSLCLGKKVRLEYDVERQDRYGRTLAYVWLDDGTFANAEIVKSGYASVMTVPPNVKYADLFVMSAAEAREKKRGLWKE